MNFQQLIMQAHSSNKTNSHESMPLKVLTKTECEKVFYSEQPIATDAYIHDRMEVSDDRIMRDPTTDYSPLQEATMDFHPTDAEWEEWSDRKVFQMRLIRREWALLGAA